MNNQKVILFLNGEVPVEIPNLSIYFKIYCTDGSYAYLRKLNIKPHVISGDFDSIHMSEIPQDVQIIPTPDQNYTDFEKALKLILEDGYKNVDVYGASGQQQDHFLGNLHAAFKFKDLLSITFYDNYSKYYFITENTTLENVLGKTISLLPYPLTEGITTEGLQYPLNNETLSITDRIGTRNKAVNNSVKITYKKGNMLVFILK